MRSLNTIEEARRFFMGLCDGLDSYTTSGGALVFLPACAMLEYLSKLVVGKDNGGQGFKDFVSVHMARVRPEYASFQYSAGQQDLPVQIYHVLRCGLVHSFSLIPDRQAQARGGRDRSVVLCHREAIVREGVTHLGHYSAGPIADAAVLVAEDFVADIRTAATRLFDEADKDAETEKRTLGWLANHPPVRGGF